MKKRVLAGAVAAALSITAAACDDTGAFLPAPEEPRMDGGTFGSGHLISDNGGGTFGSGHLTSGSGAAASDSTALGGTFGSGH